MLFFYELPGACTRFDCFQTLRHCICCQSGGGERDGVCAKVRVRIVQELVLTREGFNARLEIENGETSALENINVEIEIRETYGSAEFVNDRFSIG